MKNMYESVQNNIEDMEQVMRDTQARMRELEREREAYQKKSKACAIF